MTNDVIRDALAELVAAYSPGDEFFSLRGTRAWEAARTALAQRADEPGEWVESTDAYGRSRSVFAPADATEPAAVLAAEYERGRKAGITQVHDALQAQPVPEPKCWGWPRSDGSILDVICPEEHAREQGSYTVPLFASPQVQPVPEPLSDDDIDNACKSDICAIYALMRNDTSVGDLKPALRRISRAIERIVIERMRGQG